MKKLFIVFGLFLSASQSFAGTHLVCKGEDSKVKVNINITKADQLTATVDFKQSSNVDIAGMGFNETNLKYLVVGKRVRMSLVGSEAAAGKVQLDVNALSYENTAVGKARVIKYGKPDNEVIIIPLNCASA